MAQACRATVAVVATGSTAGGRRGEWIDRLRAAPCAPPEPGSWPRIVKQVTYDQQGNLLISGIDDHDKPWQELFGGCGPEAWLIKQLYVERRYGRRGKRYSLKKKPARRAA